MRSLTLSELADGEKEPALINDVNDFLQQRGPANLAAALDQIEPWLIAGLAGDTTRRGRPRIFLPSHDFAQYWRFRVRPDFTSHITKMDRNDESGVETPVLADLCGFRIAGISRVAVASATSTMTGDDDQAPNVYFSASVQAARHGAQLIRRVMLDDQLHNVDQWGKFGPIWAPAQFKRMVNILERGADLGARHAVNFVGLAWRDGQLVVNEGPDCYFTEADKQCPYHNLTFPSGPVADARRVITAYQTTFRQNAATIPLVWALGGHLKALLGFWPHLTIQANKGAGKSTLIKRLERSIAFTMFSGQSLQTEYRLLTSICYTSHPVGWEELSARRQDVIDKAVGLLQENYQYTITRRGSDMTEFLLCAPVMLPARVYEKHESWWFVDKDHKWHKLCRVNDGIVRLYESLAEFTRASDSKAALENTMPALIDDWVRQKLPAYASKTRSNYAKMIGLVRKEFGPQWRIEDVRPADVARFLDKHFHDKPSSSNKHKALLSLIFMHAVRRGLCDRNPAREIGAAKETKRDRYITDDELEAVRAAVVASAGHKASSARSILCLIDLAYQTAQRIGDLLALNWQNVSDEGISFHPSKTVNSSGVRLLIEMTPDLRETLDRARGGKITAIGPVIYTHAGGRFTYIGAYSGWKRACQRARLAYEKDCEEKGIAPNPLYLIGMHFHDLRAKALTDLKRQRGAAAAQSLAGHTTESMTAHYTKSREVERVQPVPLARLS